VQRAGETTVGNVRELYSPLAPEILTTVYRDEIHTFDYPILNLST